MYTVKIFGAGSIGNHLAYACRSKGWSVAICDLDKAALERTKNEIYPSRYGKWDDEIRLLDARSKDETKYDVVIIGTPPDTHAKIALEVLNNVPPRLMLIEKPMLTPSLESAEEIYKLAQEKGTFITVGYNHTLTKNTQKVEELIKEGVLGTPLTMSSETREHWGGVFAAHPWLDGPQDTYLGFSTRGGGACGEYFHAINIW
jgi:predicted dehydrogenase